MFYWRWRTRASPTAFIVWVDHEHILEALRRNGLEALNEMAAGIGQRVSDTGIESLRKERIVAEGEQRAD